MIWLVRLFIAAAIVRMLGVCLLWFRAAWAANPTDLMLKHAQRWLRHDWEDHRVQLVVYFLLDAILVAMLVVLLLETFQ